MKKSKNQKRKQAALKGWETRQKILRIFVDANYRESLPPTELKKLMGKITGNVSLQFWEDKNEG